MGRFETTVTVRCIVFPLVWPDDDDLVGMLGSA